MKYVKSANDEYILDDGENINILSRYKPDDTKRISKETTKKLNKPVFIMKTVGYTYPDL